MGTLTRLHVFECALKGEKVEVSKADFMDTELLMRVGLVSGYDEHKICYVTQDMVVDYVFTTHTLNEGTPLVNMDRKEYRSRKSLIYKDL